MSGQKKPIRVAFLHPDLGIGGAERLIVDAAMALQGIKDDESGENKYDVTVFTSHHDLTHCYDETRGRLRVHVYGDRLPTSIFGSCAILCAILRNLWAALAIVLFWPTFDIAICDQLSVGMTILRLRARRLLFYCHFPDMHLSTKRDRLLKRLYRIPFDGLERVTTAMADRCMVNSAYTAGVYRAAFPNAIARGLHPHVLHPAVNDSKLAEQQLAYEKRSESRDTSLSAAGEIDRKSGDAIRPYRVFVSINRYEHKKNIKLAIIALRELMARMGEAEFGRQRIRLIVAGGYDENRVPENVNCFKELVATARACGFSVADTIPVGGMPTAQIFDSAQVIFVRSFTDAQKVDLLNRAIAVLYTPENEHFGIVPVEAMYFRRPVIACASGGPLESMISSEIADRECDTGFLISITGPIDANNTRTAAAIAAATAADANVAVAPVAGVSHNQFIQKSEQQLTAEGRHWAAAMQLLVADPALATRIGTNGQRRVMDTFSLNAFARKLDRAVTETRALTAVDSLPARRRWTLATIVIGVLIGYALGGWNCSTAIGLLSVLIPVQLLFSN